MRNLIMAFCFLLGIASAFGQATKVTTKYAGLYDMAGDIETGRVGSILIYPETDSTLLFYLSLNRGAPSYNSGELYGRLKVKNDKGIFYWKSIYREQGCKLSFDFKNGMLKIVYIENQDACDFGFSVWANGDYVLKSNRTPYYFEDREGKKIYFSKTSPEEYNKE